MSPVQICPTQSHLGRAYRHPHSRECTRLLHVLAVQCQLQISPIVQLQVRYIRTTQMDTSLYKAVGHTVPFFAINFGLYTNANPNFTWSLVQKALSLFVDKIPPCCTHPVQKSAHFLYTKRLNSLQIWICHTKPSPSSKITLSSHSAVPSSCR